ncbi:hypothetical protein BDV95DRAFT_584705 [Massariosphaeria phaeospora]|uniref:F-box domain-containing protein n=1 Tax=Massariosphaeria phaeospora TaxID=100035 RepID=A0A7C8HZM2_9PLEO|nr:hypothetical protein BDV95DRAFT_584705 [Massariosphaeria phaeospora]
MNLDMSMFCVLCGSPFDLEPHIYNIDPDSEHFKWTYDVRLLCNPPALCHLQIDPSGEIAKIDSGSSDVFLSEITRWHMGDGDFFVLNNNHYLTLHNDQTGNLIFPLHDACIQIAVKVIDLDRKVPSRSISTLSLLYRSLCWKFHDRKFYDVGMGMDILGLDSTCDECGPNSMLALSSVSMWSGDYERYLTDPLKVPGITTFLSSILETTPQDGNHSSQTLHATREPEGLENLPNELLDRITDFLPPQSMIALRRVSKTLAVKVRLDHRFWRNNVLDGTLLPHLWELDGAGPELERLRGESRLPNDYIWNWRSLAELLSRRQFPISRRDPRLEGVPDGYWNRCRIWNIVKESLPFDHARFA